MPSVAIVGVGRLGGALAIALSNKGYDVRELVHRGSANASRIAELIPTARPSSAEERRGVTAEIVIIATPDAEVVKIGEYLNGRILDDAIVLHTSGSLGSDVLALLPNHIGSLHPLVAISDSVLGSTRFEDAFFCVEGDDVAIDASEKIVYALGGKPFSIGTNLKALYHASAVMASGHFVALEDMAIEMLTKCGISPDESKAILLPLIRSTLENMRSQPIHKALTGTFARADIDTFKRHLNSFEGRISNDIREVYLILAERSLELAQKAGVDTRRANELTQHLAAAKRVAKAKSE